MADIAKLAKVSMSTVSRALAENPLIPKEKRLEIQKIAYDAGYVINQSARSLRMRKTQTIAVVFPLGHDKGQLVSDPFFIEMFGRLADEITMRDFQVLLCRIVDTSDGWLEKVVNSQRQDGVILIGQSDQNEAIGKAASSYQQLVVWGSDTPGQGYCSVGTDNVTGGLSAVEHLLSLGRRRIAFLGMPELPEIGQRQAGYSQALTSAGIAVDPSLCVPAHFSFETAYQDAIRFVRSGVPFDAVFASSDVIALATIKALTDCHLRVPDDVSVIGFDDIAIASQSSPPLTTVRQDLAFGAKTLVDLLFKRIAGEDTTSVALKPSLIIRKSCHGDHASL